MMNKYILLIGTILLFVPKLHSQDINQYSNNNYSHHYLNTSLLSAHVWVIDQFYIDSILVENKLNPIYHYYPDGNFIRGVKDTLITGMYWQLTDENTIKLTTADQSYTEVANIITLSSCILVTRQSIKGSDGSIYHLEHRFKPYISSN